ncbi:MAG: hypothetical protein WCK33_03135 [Phycisphaerae bacterium]|jgi:hypothetical protein
MSTHRHADAPAAPGISGPLSRDQLLAAVRDDPSHVVALSAGFAALDAHPQDHPLRFLVAARMARIGLRTLASDMLAAIPPAGPFASQCRELETAAAGLPDDLVPADTFLPAVRDAFDLLVRMGAGLPDDAFAAFERHARAGRWFRTLDGTLLREHAGRLEGFERSNASLRDACARLVDAAREYTRPVALAGRCVAVTASLALEATGRAHLGYTPRLHVVEPDAVRLGEGFAELAATRHAAIDELLASERVEWHLGTGALDSLAEDLAARVDTILPDRVLAAQGSDPRTPRAVARALEAAHAAQSRRLELLHARVRDTYQDRSPAWWSERFSQRLASREPLNILVITSRFTTFVRHAATDLAAALRRAGHHAEVLMEPDLHANLAACAHLEAFRRLEPDLVVCANHPRRSLGDACPANVPYVCWVQDAMPHLFDACLGEQSTELDFLVGHLFNELFERHRFPLARALPFPVVADAVKFHDHPPTAEELESHTCDVALVSHHGETPDALHRRLVASARTNAPGFAHVLERLLEPVVAAVAAARTVPIHAAVAQACDRVLQQAGIDDPRANSMAFRGYAMPMADRLLRHQVVGWAADICDRHGLSLRLHGRGWDEHPDLAHLASGELHHGDELRAAYRCARVHLHVAAGALLHQRVIECFLSRGCCLVLHHRDALAGLKTAAQLDLLDTPPDHVDEQGARLGHSAAAFPRVAALADAMQSCGTPLPGGILWTSRERLDSLRRLEPLLRLQVGLDALGPVANEITFVDRDSLERAILSFTHDDARRERVVNAVREVAIARFTHDTLARRVIDLVANGLAIPVGATP